MKLSHHRHHLDNQHLSSKSTEFQNTNIRPSAILHHLQLLNTQANITQATTCDNQFIKQHGSSGTDDSTPIPPNANLVQDKPNV